MVRWLAQKSKRFGPVRTPALAQGRKQGQASRCRKKVATIQGLSLKLHMPRRDFSISWIRTHPRTLAAVRLRLNCKRSFAALRTTVLALFFTEGSTSKHRVQKWQIDSQRVRNERDYYGYSHESTGHLLDMPFVLVTERKLSDNQVTMARATLGKLCQISLLPLKNNNNTSSEINTINLLNFILMSPKTHVQCAT
jgi:hypothetical protein